MLPGLSAAGMMMAGVRRPAFRNLAALFAGGADGIMIDFTDKTTLFQDANGAAAVVSNGDPVGLVLDQHKWGGKTLAEYRAIQAELVSNGSFDTDISGWSPAVQGTVAWSLDGGGSLALTADGGSTPRSTITASVFVGRWYELSYDIYSADAATNRGITVGSTAGNGSMLSATTLALGTSRRWFKATATTVYLNAYGVAGAGNVTKYAHVSLKEIDGHHATQSSTARPLWASATNDVPLDGSNDYFATDFYFRDKGNCLAAWAAFGASGADRVLMGAGYTSGPTEHVYLNVNAAGSLDAYPGGNTGMSSGVSVAGTTRTILLDQQTANAQLILDGGVPTTQTTPGDMPDAARGNPLFLGCRSFNGSPNTFSNARLKRILAGQFRVQDTMSAADFHQNLIAT